MKESGGGDALAEGSGEARSLFAAHRKWGMRRSRPIGGPTGASRGEFPPSGGTAREGQARGDLWGIILAGGDGQRLRSLMRRLTGMDLPKQYCAVIGRRSMLQHTLDRVALLIPRDRIVSVITREHAVRAREQLASMPPDRLIVQPANRETGPGLLLPLLSIARCDPAATVAVFPSDHFIREEAVFMAYVAQAIGFLQHHPDLILILGIAPDHPETAYGWIEPGVKLARQAGVELLAVRGFREKPHAQLARGFFQRGFLWNSLVLVGRLETFLHAFREVQPPLWASFEAVAPALGTSREAEVLEVLYRGLPAVSLSRELLEKIPHLLGLVPVKGVHWSDWGDESRIAETLGRIGKAEEFRHRLERLRGRSSPPAGAEGGHPPDRA